MATESSALQAVSARLDYLDQKISGHMQEIARNLDALTVQAVQLNSAVKENSRAIDRLAQAVEADRQITQQLIELAQNQQQTIDRMIKPQA